MCRGTKKNRSAFLWVVLLMVLLTACRKDSDDIVSTEDRGGGGSSGKFQTASEAVTQMGTGWNLGNTLDSLDGKKRNNESMALKKTEYQIMLVYENADWSGWDASPVPFFDGRGSVSHTWNIQKLASSLKGTSGKFRVQLINNQIETADGAMLRFKITKAEFVTKNRIVIVLNDLLGEHELPFQKQKTPYLDAELSQIPQLRTASDILEGTLNIDASITGYPTVLNSGSPKSAAEYYETLWGNPVTTRGMIDTVAKAGFGAVRLPVTYYDHMDEKGTIDADWLSRVKEVVDYVLDSGMYCIIDIHHDSGEDGWISADLPTIEQQKQNLSLVWSQIARQFRDYDEKLVFEGFNEILNGRKQWTGAGSDAYEAVNLLNQAFVDTVRSSGGNNRERNLIIKPYAASNDADALKNFRIPADTAQQHLLTSIHYYSDFKEEPDRFDKALQRVKQYFVDQKLPVLIGEYSSWNNWNEEDGLVYVRTIMGKARDNGLAVFWWDRGGSKKTAAPQTETLLDRNTLQWYSDAMLKALLLK